MEHDQISLTDVEDERKTGEYENVNRTAETIAIA